MTLNRCALLMGLMTALLASPALATTPKTITVDGDLGDFDQTDRRPDDGAGDSTFNSSNELDQLYVNWDSNKLYLGFDFRVQQAAVIYYIRGTGAGATTTFCSVNAFPAAAVTSKAMDYMVALYADQALHGYKLASGVATEDTSMAQARSANVADGSRVSAEVGIPWTSIFPSGIPSGATVEIAGALRGQNDGDLLGDVNPGGAGAVSSGNCSGTPTTISQYHLIHIDDDGNGAPDSDWNPGTDTAAGTPTDGGPADAGPDQVDGAIPTDGPAGDDGPPPADVPVGQDGPQPDDPAPRDDADGSVVTDAPRPPQDRQLADFPGNDRRIGVVPDSGGGQPTPSTGCACSTGTPAGHADLGGTLIALAVAALLIGAPAGRRRRR